MSKRRTKTKKKQKTNPPASESTPPRIGKGHTSRWLALLSLVGVGAVAALYWSRSGRLDLAPSPNILLITVDTLRADHLGAYGSPVVTPHIDTLAREGIVFEKTISPVPVTLPSHTSLFTGCYPIAHGVRDNGSFRLDDEWETLTEVFKSAGYQTGAFIGSFALDSRFGLDQGFDTYDDYYGDTSAISSMAISERPADDVLKPARAWLEQRDSPWFAFVHLWDPHHPYQPPSPFRDMHPDDPYTGEIAYVDDALGRFLAALEDEGRLDNTLIVVTADHGEGLGDHSEKTHGMFAYESTLHVPLILHWKDSLPEGRRVPTRVRLIDVAPTLLELASHQGESLVPLILGPSNEDDREMYFEAMAFNLNRNWAPLNGVYAGSYKYIELPIPELFDLDADPEESNNLYQAGTELSREMKAALTRIVNSHSTEATREIRTTAVDEETAARLRALGYIIQPEASGRPKEYTEDDDPKRLVHLSDKLDEGVAAHASGRSEEAIRIFRELIEERPTFANAYANLAHVLHETGRLREAIAVIEHALEQGIQTRTMMGRLGLYYQEAGDLERSVEILEAVIESDPTYVEAYNYLSVSYSRLGRYEDAIQANHTLLELDASYASGYNNLGSIYLSMGRLPAAQDNLRRALELDPRLSTGWNGLGVVYAQSGRESEAIEAWKRAVELDPSQYDTIYNLGTLLTQLNRFQEALPFLELFVRTAPHDPYARDIAGIERLITQLRAAGH